MTRKRHVGTVLCALAILMSGQAQAQNAAGGFLQVEPSGPTVCPKGNVFFGGQDVRVRGSGFSSGASVEIFYGLNEDPLQLLQTTTASSSGVLDDVVTLPAGPPAPAAGVVEAQGATTGGKQLYLRTLMQVVDSPGPDSDGDLVPDVCDNCPSLSNAGQDDADLDGRGDLCDACPSDAANDSDGDGLCADADPCRFDPDNDVDMDGRCGDVDNCPDVPNPNQLDQDSNGVGDACQTNPSCSDGLDNDGDGLIDHPEDTGCSDPADTTETDPAQPCDDGIDNDRDALTDFRPGSSGDPGCASGTSPSEDPECDDGEDNDGDGTVDWDGRFSGTPDPECAGMGSHDSELLPEPHASWGLVAGTALLFALRRRRKGA